MAWHMGYPLSQSLFTSVYLDRLLWPEPKTLEEARFTRAGEAQDDNRLLYVVLRAYCLAVIKTCDLVHGRITKETYYEVDCYHFERISRLNLDLGRGFRNQSLQSKTILRL